MAEGGGGEGSWWGWLQDAKEKVVSQSSEVLEFVKKDIDEFTKVVSEEASSVVSTTANTLKEKLRLDEDDSTANNMKKSMSGFLSHVAEVFTPPPDDADQEAIIIRNQQPVILNRLQAAIYAVSQDADTYLTDPEGDEANYEEWLATFDIESRQTQLSDLLVNNQPLRQHYTTLVPAQVSHVVFWHRYFYKVQQLETAEQRRQLLKERAEKTAADPELIWDEDEEFGGDVEIPEEMQNQLLEEYQRECEEKDKTNGTNGKDKGNDGKDKTNGKDKSNGKTTHKTDEGGKEGKTELLKELKVDLSKTSDSSSKPSPSSTESIEDDWELVEDEKWEFVQDQFYFDLTLESNEDEWEKVEATDAAGSSASSTTSDKDKKKDNKIEDPKSEEWESWD